MKAIVTGASGTLGLVLCSRMAESGHAAIPWDRSRVPIDDYHAMESFVRNSGADTLFHLAIASKPTGREAEGWLVNYQWPSELAWIARQTGVRYVFTSTVLVFTNAAPGPLTLESLPDETGGYGGEKRWAEERVFNQNPDTRVARMGWQIGAAPGSNNMIDFFHQHMAKDGVIRASTRWLPACSFLEDTADALVRVAALPPGLYLLDSNRGMNFFEIATALNGLHGDAWKIEATEDFVLDQRMIDARAGMPDLKARLGEKTRKRAR